jgi:hypothetical protein
MMRLFAVLLLLIPMGSFSQALNAEYGSPIIVLTEKNPWLRVVGSDVPNFVLYEKGQIIYKKIKKDTVEYKQLKLDPIQTQNFILDLGIQDALFRLSDHISASGATDQPTNELILNFDTLKIITVYGMLREKTAKGRLQTPKAFIDIYDKLINYDTSIAVAWVPKQIEIMAWNYGHSVISRPWPKGWPDLHSATTVKRTPDMYSIYIDRKYFSDFRKYFGSMKEKESVDIDGKKMAIYYRFPFPNIR